MDVFFWNMDEMELLDYLRVLRRWWWLILPGVLLGGVTGYIFSYFEPLVYEAKATLMIGNFVQSANPNPTELATSQQLAKSYAEVIKREPILRATVEGLGLNTGWPGLRDRIQVNLIPNTQFFEIRVTDYDPDRAKLLVDELTRQLILQSPTTLTLEQASQREFVEAELHEAQQNILELRQRIRDLQAALDLEITAEGVQQKQADIDQLQARLSSLQSTYASMLAFTQEQQVNNLTVIEPAVVPSSPVNEDITQNNLLGGMAIGLLLTVGVVFLWEYLDNTIKTVNDVERTLELPVLATIADIVTVKSTGEVVVSNGAGFAPSVEAYRALRTSIQFASPATPLATLLITSSIEGEGKSMTASNLAVVMAQAHKRVILVDADLRRPAQHKIFKIPNRLGLSSLLLNPDLNLTSTLACRKVSSLRILPSGPLPPNPAELLGSPQMGQLLAQLCHEADMVIIDSSPLLAVTDASLLATQVDGTILVLEAGRNRVGICQRSQAVLGQVGITPLGVVLNKFKPQQGSDGYYYSYDYYSPYHQRGLVENGRETKREEIKSNF